MISLDGLVWVFRRRRWVGARKVLEIPRDRCQFAQVEEGPGAEMAYLRKMEQECEYSRRPSIMWIGSVVSVFLAGLAVVAPAVAVARVVVEVVVAAVTVADAVAVVAGWTR
ncbi:unnamed protein product [Fusarium graminearum]|nr:unnamed protein product [Fusarium graminearum]VTO91987.1 unnamed protein product [Fusarium graminearum]